MKQAKFRTVEALLGEAEPLVQGTPPPGACTHLEQLGAPCGKCNPCSVRLNKTIDRLFPLLVDALREEHRRVLELLEEIRKDTETFRQISENLEH